MYVHQKSFYVLIVLHCSPSLDLFAGSLTRQEGQDKDPTVNLKNNILVVFVFHTPKIFKHPTNVLY